MGPGKQHLMRAYIAASSVVFIVEIEVNFEEKSL